MEVLYTLLLADEAFHPLAFSNQLGIPSLSESQPEGREAEVMPKPFQPSESLSLSIKPGLPERLPYLVNVPWRLSDTRRASLLSRPA